MSSGVFADFIAGWVGGVLCTIVGYPFDTVKVRQQNFSASLFVATKETLKYEGILGFYRGILSPLVAYGPSNSIFFGCHNIIMKLINGSHPGAPSRTRHKATYLINVFFSGSLAGFVQAVIMCPVDLVKIALQTNTRSSSVWVHNSNSIEYEGLTHAVRTITKYQGLAGLYKGFVPMMYRDVPTSGVYLIVYESLLPDDRKWYQKIYAGGSAGIAAISVVLPVDVVKTRIQADDPVYPRYKGMRDCIKKIYEEEGYRIFWKGLPVITLRAFPANAVLFIGYEMTLDIFRATR
ncbi:solute carrier family 25 member 48-like [Sitophilus oryzae]|uniref:Solute carrier family 25 member 48-like n=1 Tax=Sitophilus oryzae TaxID=7048 RepID=A0A6J2YK08_SITOR|nr:solute carrier family 25 member 48-like [Sitophilus oryzae]